MSSFNKILGVCVICVLSFYNSKATDYYFSSSIGNDNTNNGLSQASPWRSVTKINNLTYLPGDRILLKGGETFNGTIFLADKGATNNYIVITSYGQGKAIINGGIGNGINLYNTSYLKVSNLLIQGDGRKKGNDQGVGIDIQESSYIEADQIEATGFQSVGINILPIKRFYFQGYENSKKSAYLILFYVGRYVQKTQRFFL